MKCACGTFWNASLHKSAKLIYFIVAKPLLYICIANTSFANIHEAHYAHRMADFIAKLQIALKEANETGYWLEILYKTNYIDETVYKSLDSKSTSIRIMPISSINTAKQNNEKSK